MSYTERKDCRACRGELELIHDFGEFEVVNFGDKEQLRSPLVLTKCKSCHLIQLKHNVNPDLLFRNYYYKSGVNQTMRNHLQSIVEDIQNRIHLEKFDTVIDIGSNDGTLLRFYQKGLRKIGFEPSQIALDSGTASYTLFPEYFSAKAFFGNERVTYLAKVITCIAMFYDLDDPNKFLDDIKAVLAPDGLFVIEMNYLPAMLENNRVDNIVAEHLCYYSFRSLQALLIQHGFDIEHTEFDDINGGVMRNYIRHIPEGITVKPVPAYLNQVISHEYEMQLDKIETYQHFINRIQTNYQRLNHFISVVKNGQAKTVDCYAASTRGLILMQLAELDNKLIRYAVDRNPAKWGKTYNGIKIISEEQMRKDPPDYLFILAQGFLPEFIQREMKFLQDGGKFILPFPKPQVLSIDSI